MMVEITLEQANKIMQETHYLGPCKAAGVQCFGWVEEGTVVAAAIYADPHAPKIPARYRDLRRLSKREEMRAPLSKFLSNTLNALEKGKWDAAITWADQAAGHHGGIYQATNWIYLEPQSYNWNSSYELPDGTIKNHRTVFKELGTTAKQKVKALRPDWIPFLPKMKFRYVYPMTKNITIIQKELNGKVSKYPKPNGSEVRRVDYRRIVVDA